MKLLLAEDEIELARAVGMLLRHSNYIVDIVHNGQDAYDYLTAAHYDAAVLDIMMPGMDGLTVVQKLREENRMIPVLLLTARSETDDIVQGLDAGADDYLTKPFEMKELLARIRAMGRRKENRLQMTMQSGNVRLNPDTFELYTEKGRCRLTSKEYQLMEVFINNPGQIMATERLMEKIWGYESEAEINVVWVNVSALRKKLKEIGADVFIRTNRGIGYSLEKVI